MVKDSKLTLESINSKFIKRLQSLNFKGFKNEDAEILGKEWNTFIKSEELVISDIEVEENWIQCLKNKDEIALSKWTELFTQDLLFWGKCIEKYSEMKAMELTKKNDQTFKYHPKEISILRRYFFGICPSSFKILKDPKFCSGCMSIGYYSKEDQKKDWKAHKPVCKIFQTIVKSGKHGMPGMHPLSQDPGSKSKQFQLLLTNAFGRALQQDESDMLNYPRLCVVCLSGKQSSLIHCSNCQSACYCSEAHLEEDKEEHMKSCSQLKICLEDYQIERMHNDHPSKSYLPRCSKYVYEPLPKEGIYEFLKPEISLMLSKTKQRISSETRYASFHYTCPLTILYGLQESIVDLKERENLVIEIVGARIAETNDLTKWEVISLRLPKLKSITFVFIGPEIEVDMIGSHVKGTSKYLKTFRPELKQDFHFMRMDYEAFHKKEAKKIAAPDLVAVLNCGFIFYSSWDVSIPLMVSRGSYLLFTEYYEEDARFNLAKIEDLWTGSEDVNVILEPTSNPYCSALPARIPTGFHFREFKRRNYVMSNDYICIVSKN